MKNFPLATIALIAAGTTAVIFGSVELSMSATAVAAASEQPLDPTDVADRKLAADGAGRATLTCPKCGDASPVGVAKEQ